MEVPASIKAGFGPSGLTLAGFVGQGLAAASVRQGLALALQPSENGLNGL